MFNRWKTSLLASPDGDKVNNRQFQFWSKLCVGQIEASTCPPGQPPGYLTFLKIIVQIPPYPGQNAVQMPHTGVHSGDQMPPRGHFTGTKMTEGRQKRFDLTDTLMRRNRSF